MQPLTPPHLLTPKRAEGPQASQTAISTGPDRDHQVTARFRQLIPKTFHHFGGKRRQNSTDGGRVFQDFSETLIVTIICHG